MSSSYSNKSSSQDRDREEASRSGSSSASKSSKSGASQGRGWHGDPEGHAEAGRQSHKNDQSSSAKRSSSGSR